MSSVPYVFASQTGNIPLSQLDANFSNVKASVDYAATAGSANTATLAATATVAARVTANAQPNITSVGSTFTVTGNIIGGNLLLSGNSSSTGNVNGGNIIAANAVSATSYTGATASLTGNIVAGNLAAITTFCNLLISNIANINGNIVSTGTFSTTGNIVGGNIITSGSVQNTGLAVGAVNYVSVTGNAATTSLSTTISRNILIADNTGYTHTINMPTSPVDGQITNFAVSGNTMTLVVGTGTVTPTFAGSATAGTAYTYIYRNSNTTWYRTN